MEQDGTETVRPGPARRWNDFTSPGTVRARVSRGDRRGIELLRRLCAVTLFSGFALLALPALAGAATIVVDDTGIPSGTPSPAGTCEAPNYGTIQAAVDAATVGDTIEVCSGTYAEQVEISKDDITLNGPNAGRSVGPEAGDPRGPEAIIAPPIDMLAE
jgi:pectin methylesterase-like acyl-CoA thioesterase